MCSNMARSGWHDVFKVLKGKNLPPRILYPARLSFRIEGERTSQTSRNTKNLSIVNPP